MRSRSASMFWLMFLCVEAQVCNYTTRWTQKTFLVSYIISTLVHNIVLKRLKSQDKQGAIEKTRNIFLLFYSIIFTLRWFLKLKTNNCVVLFYDGIELALFSILFYFFFFFWIVFEFTRNNIHTKWNSRLHFY